MMHNVHIGAQEDLSTAEHISAASNETVAVPLTRGMVTIVDASDAEWLGQWRWVTICSRPGRFYAGRFVKELGKANSTCILMHREILRPAPGLHCDHIDNDSLNNVRSNLRAVSRCQNAQNAPARRKNTTGYKGVSRCGNKYVAQICANRKPMRLGRFDTPEEAHAAYAAAARELHGDYARLA